MAHVRVEPKEVPREVWTAMCNLQRALLAWEGVMHAQITYDNVKGFESIPKVDVITAEPVI